MLNHIFLISNESGKMHIVHDTCSVIVFWLIRMSDSPVVRTWEERVIVPERGSRIVHFIINDSLGNSVLAVVGRERCLNHMVYMISEDFLRVFGSTSTIRAGKKWQARRDAVEWLASVVAKGGPVLANSSMSWSLEL